jgi:hypothetical protein
MAIRTINLNQKSGLNIDRTKYRFEISKLRTV